MRKLFLKRWLLECIALNIVFWILILIISEIFTLFNKELNAAGIVAIYILAIILYDKIILKKLRKIKKNHLKTKGE